MRRKEREITDIATIESIIRRSDTCRVALVDGDEPYLVAMNFGYLNGDKPLVYFHCAPEGRKLDIIRKNNKAAFLFDTDHLLVGGEKACDFTMKYSSVAGKGILSVVTSNEERNLGMNCIMKQYTGNGDYSFSPSTFSRTTILKLEIQEMSGKVVK